VADETTDSSSESKGNVELPRNNSNGSLLGTQFLVSIVAAILVVAAAAGLNHAFPIFGTSDDGDGGTVVAQNTPGAQPTAATPVPVEIDVGDNPAKGPTDAKVTIVEFSDFQCPYCARFVQETMPTLLQNYGDKVRFVFMNFPLSQIHADAEKAAEASECAHDQGAFWQYHDLLFQNQGALDVASLKNYAQAAGLDAEKFNQCLDSGEKASAVQADVETATKAVQEAGLERWNAGVLHQR
jgi:protein-disulfide isomerase